MGTEPSTNPSREQMRIAEEEGKLPPGRRRRQPAEAQDASLHEDLPHSGHPDGEKVDRDKEKGPPDPAARGRDAPVDLR